LFASTSAFCGAEQDKFDCIKDLSYTARSDDYSKERCKLDVYTPKGKKNFPVYVWFHGGGISAGNKHFPRGFETADFAIVAVNYRLSPKIKAHEALDDAADAVVWVLKNIESYGGDKSKVFVGGHSAGAYLSGMVGFAPKYLESRGFKNTDLAGMILLSGQATTHFRVRNDLGDKNPQFLPKIDKLSLMGNADSKMSPLCIVLGDRAIEFPERVEENLLLASVVKKLNSSKMVEIYELQGLDHGTVSYGLFPIARGFVTKVCKSAEADKNAAASKNN